MSESTYRFFKRDISWLSFNERVLLEARDERLPVYERIKFFPTHQPGGVLQDTCFGLPQLVAQEH